MSSSCRIAIVGGGLAGLAAANALSTFGIKAEVFETAPAVGEIEPASRHSDTSDRRWRQGRRCRELIAWNLHAQHANR